MKKIIFFSLLLTAPAWALDLQTKPHNTDRRTFNVNPGVKVEENKWSLFSEFNMSAKPLVSRGSRSGNTIPLVDNFYSIELGGNYGVTDWLQMGLLFPLDLPSGVVEGGAFMNGPYFEAKMQVSDHFAIVPSYQFKSKERVTVTNEGSRSSFILGAPSGTIGAKVVGEMGDVNQAFGAAAYIGYYSSPDNQFLTIDQTSRLTFGASAGVPISKSINGILELYGEKTPSNTPLELMGMVNVKEEAFNWQVGAGSGNLQFSGSNTFKAFVGINFAFGGDQKKARGMNYVPMTPSTRARNRTPDRIEFAPIPSQDEEMEEQKAPVVPEPTTPAAPVIPDVPERESSLTKGGRTLASNSIIIESKDEEEVIKTEDPLQKVVGEKPVKKSTAAKVGAQPAPKKKRAARMVVLPNGKKAMVFKNKITALPQDPNVVYMTEKDYAQLLAQPAAPVAAPTSAPVSALESDPEPVLPPSPNLALPVESLTLPKAQPLVVVDGVQEKVLDQDQVIKNGAQEQRIEVLTVTPVEAKIIDSPVLLSKEDLKAALEEELSQPLPSTSKNPISIAGQSEVDKIEAEMARQKAATELALQKAATEKAAAAAQAEEIRVRREAPLTESGQVMYGKAATDQELHAVKVKNGTRIAIPRTRADAFLMNRPLEDRPAIESGNLELLEEKGSAEESSGPDYGL